MDDFRSSPEPVINSEDTADKVPDKDRPFEFVGLQLFVENSKRRESDNYDAFSKASTSSVSSIRSTNKRKHWEFIDEDESSEETFGFEDDMDSMSSYDYGMGVPNNVSRASSQKSRIIVPKGEKLDLDCEWDICSYKTNSVDDFIKHVAYHIPDLEIRENDESEEVYGCLWKLCNYETSDSEEVKRHVNYHSYHGKMKSAGRNQLTRIPGINMCLMDSNQRNEVPDLPNPYVCNWDTCNQSFSNSQVFFYHVRQHAELLRERQEVVNHVVCQWTHCRQIFRAVYRLVDHLRSHTKEKKFACPTCGACFTSSTKLVDHVQRQSTDKEQSFQCSHCSKYFSSERLLRNHMRHHVNHYKCTFCNMTCPTPSNLSTHIRYKHLDDAPFHCHCCPHKAKTKHDLSMHMSSHMEASAYECQRKGCSYRCRSAYGLSKHLSKVHGDDEPDYCCHLCDERYHRGSYLTKHLSKEHDIRWPDGHCRFRYKLNDEGMYQLETVRYESLEVTQEMRQAEPSNLDRSEPNMLTRTKSVHITIEQLDERGNIIDSNEIEADELTDLPVGQDATLLEEGPRFTLK